ncbi:hypothetical protein BX600DRAFT_390787 [Xylariales sp. PMI_506]|nr:hypothetical protein BX600DRAFT_390787 [Xylariales sp. PMI_506]
MVNGPEARKGGKDTQAEHRIGLLSAWYPAIKPGTRVLELGCGQGTCTQVLAEAVGDTGLVDAVDPGSPDYGAPITLSQAQGNLSAGSLGSRISWHQADPIEFLSAPARSETTWDVAVLAHCIWYFKSPTALAEILLALKGRVDMICIAEYAMRASHAAAVPHVLTTIARASLEAHKDREHSDENIQIPLSPLAIKRIAKESGWAVETEGIVVPDQGLDDGRWEAKTVVSKAYLEDVENYVSDDRLKEILKSARDAVVLAVEGIGGVQVVRTMDVWVGTLIMDHET